MWLAHNGNESDSGSAEEKLNALNRAGSRIQELVGQIDALPDSPARVLFQDTEEARRQRRGRNLRGGRRVRVG